MERKMKKCISRERDQKIKRDKFGKEWGKLAHLPQKIVFFSRQSTKAFSPFPPRLSGQKNLGCPLKKIFLWLPLGELNIFKNSVCNS